VRKKRKLSQEKKEGWWCTKGKNRALELCGHEGYGSLGEIKGGGTRYRLYTHWSMASTKGWKTGKGGRFKLPICASSRKGEKGVSIKERREKWFGRERRVERQRAGEPHRESDMCRFGRRGERTAAAEKKRVV